MPSEFQNGTKGDSKVHLASIDLSFTEKKGVLSRRSTLEKCLLACLLLFIIVVVVLAVLVAQKSSNEPPPAPQEVCNTPECANSASRLLAGLDKSVNPCENFYNFACGTWMKKNVIPEDRSNLNVFGVLRDEVEVVLKYLLEDEHKADEPEAVNKTRIMYASCLDEDEISRRGISVAHPLLQELGGWPILGNKEGGNWNSSSYDLTKLLLALMKYNNKPLINMYVYTDLKNSTVRIIYVDQPGFGMPGRKYYLVNETDKNIVAYKQFIKDVAIGFGAESMVADKDVDELVDLETDIANISVAAEDRRDSNLQYNPIQLAQLSENFTVPEGVKFNWTDYITGIMGAPGVNLSVPDDEIIIVRSVPYFQKLFTVLEKHGPRAVANYAVWRIMQNRVNNLDKTFEDMKTKYNKVLYGTAVPRARWRTCTSYVNSNMGLALGRLFVKEAFDEESKKDTEAMIANLKVAFKEILNKLDWMDDATRASASEKAEYIQQKIGYQDAILIDKKLNEMYENYTVTPGFYFENVISLLSTISKESLRYLRTRVDKDWWTTAPPTVNAYYNSVLNRIMFPAGILQPPFYGNSQPKSMNYGGIGVVIGHEITHGFDDRGRQYDKDGNLEQWWSDSAISKFKDRAQCLVDQYGDFKLPEANDMNLNGINTQGENIADNGGLAQSFQAYRKWVEDNGEEPRLPGIEYTHNQIFFINFAQIWCSNLREANAINRILTGVHSPGRFRVIGTLQNSEDFAKTFNCPKGSYMNPPKKCTVW